MTYGKPPEKRSAAEPTGAADPWPQPDEDDLFPDDMVIDPRDDFDEALDRVLARQVSPRTGRDLDDPPGGAPGDPFDRYAGTAAARDLQAAADLAAAPGKPTEAVFEEDLDEPGYAAEEGLGEELRQPREGWGLPFAVAAAVGGVLVGGSGLWVALDLSDRVEALEAQLGSIAPIAAPQEVADAEPSANSASLRSLREELRETSEQLRARVSEDIVALRADLRELEARTDEQWQKRESTAEEVLDTRVETATSQRPPPASRSAPSQAPKATARSAAKVLTAKPSSGPWAVAVASFEDPAVADQQVARLRKQGLEAEARPVLSGGRTWHRITVGGFPTREAAQAYVDSAKLDVNLAPAFADYWIGRR